MRKYTVYKILDDKGKTLWVGFTPHSIERILKQHRMLIKEFASHEVDRSYKTQAGAFKRESELLKQCIDEDGSLPPYILRTPLRA